MEHLIILAFSFPFFPHAGNLKMLMYNNLEVI